jgi:hypothetical protein
VSKKHTTSLASRVWHSIIVIAFVALGVDSLGNPLSFVKFTTIDSGLVFLTAFVSTYIACKTDTVRLISTALHWLRYVIFPTTVVFASIGVFADTFMYPNYVYSLTRINYPQVTYIAILAGWILFWHTDTHWREKYAKHLIFTSGCILLGLAWIISLWPFDVFIKLSHEDSLIETVQFITLFVAGLHAFRIFFHLFTKRYISIALVYVVITLGLFAVAGDEIAWGQRLLGVPSPEYFQVNNVQNEITFHNLETFPISVALLYTLVGLWGSVSWIGVKYQTTKHTGLLISLLTSRWYVFPYFFAAFVFNLRLLFGAPLGHWAEMMELMIYLGVSLLLSMYVRDMLVKKPIPHTS